MGPSAHSYNLKSRQWNIAVNSKYIERLNQGKTYFETEVLSDSDRFNEYLMLSLRTMWGTNMDKLFSITRPQNPEAYLNKLEYFINMDWIKKESDKIYLTSEGILFSDHILSELFIDKEAGTYSE